jgi:hypothetical protein
MVFCLQNLRTIASKEEREAELALLAGGNLQEAEGHYLQGNKPLHAIMLHLNEHNWDRLVEKGKGYQLEISKHAMVTFY